MNPTTALCLLVTFLSLVGASLYTLNEFKSAEERDEDIHTRVRRLEDKVRGERISLGEKIDNLEKMLKLSQYSSGESTVKIDTLKSFADESTVRTFVSTSGKTMEAQILYAQGANVSIRRIDGTEFTIPLSQLIKRDQIYVAEWRAKHPDVQPPPDRAPEAKPDGSEEPDEEAWRKLFD